MQKFTINKAFLRAAITSLVMVCLAAVQGLGAETTVPYFSYTYNDWGESIPTSAAYEPGIVVPGTAMIAGGLNSPKDMCYQGGFLYILDSGNKRVVVLDGEFNFVRTIDKFSQNGTPIELNDVIGIAVDQTGRLVIADQGNKAVYISDLQGNISLILERPASDLIPDSVDFLPQKVLVDQNGILYVLATGIYQGALTFDTEGNFLGFFGSNKVTVTGQLLKDRMWRLFFSDKQKDKMIRYVPVEYQNFALGTDNFVYTVSNYEDDSQKGQVKKLNPLSSNILFAGQKPYLATFGDLDKIWTGRLEKSRLTAINVDDKDFINVLDLERGRIFQYDQMCNLITIFGGEADQQGCFRNPVAITTINDDVVVLDEQKGSVTTFRLTDLGKSIHEGTVLYNQGLYQEALEPWYKALRKDSFSWLALRGIGRALERLGRYDESMEYFKKAYTQGAYSQAMRESRTENLRKNFGLVLFVLFLIIAVPVVIGYLRKRNKKPEDRVRVRSKWEYPFYLMFHPFKGWEEFRHDKKGSLLFANLIIFAWLVVLIAEYQFTGFVFNPNRLESMNILVLMIPTIFFFMVGTVANWAFSTLQDGKGKFRDIWIFGSYAMLSPVLFTIPAIILTNMLVGEEGFFIMLVYNLLNLWALVQFIMATKAVQQYTIKKTLISLFLTLIGVILIVLVVVLFYSLFSQLFGFGQTIIQELMMRS